MKNALASNGSTPREFAGHFLRKLEPGNLMKVSQLSEEERVQFMQGCFRDFLAIMETTRASSFEVHEALKQVRTMQQNGFQVIADTTSRMRYRLMEYYTTTEEDFSTLAWYDLAVRQQLAKLPPPEAQDKVIAEAVMGENISEGSAIISSSSLA